MYRLDAYSQGLFQQAPEIGMDLQIGRVRGTADDYVFVISGCIVAIMDEQFERAMKARNDLRYFDRAQTRQRQIDLFDMWLGSLPEVSYVEPVVEDDDPNATLGFVSLGPRGPLPPAPWRPYNIYGHHLFHGATAHQDVYYRYERSPRPRRFDIATGAVNRGFITAPPADMPLLKSGLHAAARFALPYLQPACWRYELRPPPGTLLHYGASISIYGPSGGGVEIDFPRGFLNLGPIAEPVVLPEV